MKSIVCLALLLPAVALGCKVDGGTKKDGDTWTEGDFQMKCFTYKNNPKKSWETKVSACIWRLKDAEDKVIPVGKTENYKGQTGICTEEKDGGAYFKTEGGTNNKAEGQTETGTKVDQKPTVCKYKGAEKKDAETWIENNFQMKCVVVTGDPKKAWEVVVSGCIYPKAPNTEVIPVGETRKYGSVTARCFSDNGVTTLKTEGGELPEGKKEEVEVKVSKPEGGKVVPKVDKATEDKASKDDKDEDLKCKHYDADGKDKEYTVGQEWLKDLYYFSCIKDGDSGWKVIVSGCHWEQFDFKVPTGETMKKTEGEAYYTADCAKKDDGTVVLGVEGIA